MRAAAATVLVLVAASAGATGLGTEHRSALPPPGGPAPAAREPLSGAMSETLWIFDADFENTSGDNAGWTSSDMSGTLGHDNYWHVDTIRTPLSRPYLGDYTWWCGTYNVCWRQPRGYGNNWVEILERAFPEVDQNTNPGDQLQLEWDQRYAMERFYDYGYVDVSADGGTNWTTIRTFTNGGFHGPGRPVNWDDATYGHIVVDADASAGLPNLKLRFRFESDGAYSSEDTPDNPLHSVKDGAWQLDNIKWSKGTPPVAFWLDDCESGGDPQWLHDDTPAAGQTGVTWRRGQFGIDFVTGRPPMSGEPPVGTWMYAAVDTGTGKVVDGEYTWLLTPPIDISQAGHLAARWEGWVDCPQESNDLFCICAASGYIAECISWDDPFDSCWSEGCWYGGPRWGRWTDNWDAYAGAHWLAVRYVIWNTELPDPGFGHMGGMFVNRLRVGVPLTTAVPDGDDTAAWVLTIGQTPSCESAAIQYSLASAGRVSLAVFDLAGRRVRTLVDAPVSAGDHEVVWDGTTDTGDRAASGVYFVRMEAPGFEAGRKMVLLK
jgi:hypothetical protein